jgi:Tfp pilus assembly protein PilF
MQLRHTSTLSGLFLLIACAGSPPVEDTNTVEKAAPSAPLANITLFGPSEPAPPPEALISLTPEQEQNFLDYFHGDTVRRLPAHRRIRDFLANRMEGFSYLDDTLSASQSMAEYRGNCMSLAALTIALGNVVGAETRFQMVNATPVFDRDDRTIISSDHVRSRVYDPDYEPKPGTIVLQRPHVLIDYVPGSGRGIGGRTVSHQEFMAMLYRNLAAEAMLEGNLDKAFTLSREALTHYPDHADSLNLLAVLHRRAGDSLTAEAFYEYAARVHGDRVDILSNLENLLRHQGRIEEADRVESRLARLDDPNPFHWLELGEQARKRGRPQQALQWYAEALERAPYLHEAHWRMAIAYKELGHPLRSMEALARAKALSRRQDQSNYQAKLHTMESEYGALRSN